MLLICESQLFFFKQLFPLFKLILRHEILESTLKQEKGMLSPPVNQFSHHLLLVSLVLNVLLPLLKALTDSFVIVVGQGISDYPLCLLS